MVTVVLSPTALAGPTGMANNIALGFDSVVVKIKKVISKKARSTIAVRSTLTDSFLREPLPPVFWDAVNSAITLVF
jgi:hypothetical protein